MDGTNFRRILLRASTSQYIPCSKQGRKDTPVKNDAPIDEKEQEQETSSESSGVLASSGQFWDSFGDTILFLLTAKDKNARIQPWRE